MWGGIYLTPVPGIKQHDKASYVKNIQLRQAIADIWVMELNKERTGKNQAATDIARRYDVKNMIDRYIDMIERVMEG